MHVKHRLITFAATITGLVAGVFVVALPSAALAQAPKILYVDADPARCDDGRSVQEASRAPTPWCSLAQALDRAGPGTTVQARGGTYPRLVLDGYTRSASVTLRAAPDEAVTLEGLELSAADHLRFEGIRFSARVDILRSGHDLAFVGNDIGDQRSGLYFFGWEGEEIDGVLIEGNRIHDIDYTGEQGVAEGYGITMAGNVRNVTIRENTIQRVGEDWIQGGAGHITVEGNRFLGPSLAASHPQAHADVWQIFGTADHITFRGNIVRRTGASTGLLFQFSGAARPYRDIAIENNVFDEAAAGYAMQIYNTRGLRIVNNTVVDSRYGTLLRDEPSVPDGSGYLVVNNIFSAREGAPLSIEADWGDEDHNLIIGGTPGAGWGAHDLVGADPDFVNRTQDNLRLRAGSPGLDAGSAAGAPATDVSGRPRGSRPDLGAYELTTAPPRPPDGTEAGGATSAQDEAGRGTTSSAKGGTSTQETTLRVGGVCILIVVLVGTVFATARRRRRTRLAR